MNEIRQSHTSAVVGWVARTELSPGRYTEHWCLFRGFRNFGADSTTATTFRSTTTMFNANQFNADCHMAEGSYHVATVEQRY